MFQVEKIQKNQSLGPNAPRATSVIIGSFWCDHPAGQFNAPGDEKGRRHLKNKDGEAIAAGDAESVRAFFDLFLNIRC